MSARSYLSIGDVLTLLRQEFPDVTISKIRFLESQGLVNPERTPSGYRKFYEHDVERLRWVLRQQREHFLPLKVIKDRLDDGMTDSEPADDEHAAAGPEAGEAGIDHASAPDPEVSQKDPVLVGAASRPPEHDRSTLPGIEPQAAVAAPGGGSRARSGASESEVSPATRPRLHRAPGAPAASSRPAVPGPPPPPGAPSGPRQRTPARPASPGPGSPATPRGAGPADTSSEHAGAAQGPVPASRDQKRVPAGGRVPQPPSTEMNGASFSLEELSAECGLAPEGILELEEYGLVTATPVGGIPYFDDQALTVAKLAASFARYGIGPRHLRLYKNAAEREAGFVEQIVIPLVRQRNPEARARAHTTADELTDLGQQLRSSLLQASLTQLLRS